jgi:hypothetical protein
MVMFGFIKYGKKRFILWERNNILTRGNDGQSCCIYSCFSRRVFDNNLCVEEAKMMKPKTGFCKKCCCRPCYCTELALARKNGSKTCISCGTELGLRGGYVGTDLCGPCCTGEAETLDEQFIEW